MIAIRFTGLFFLCLTWLLGNVKCHVAPTFLPDSARVDTRVPVYTVEPACEWVWGAGGAASWEKPQSQGSGLPLPASWLGDLELFSTLDSASSPE